MLPTEYYDTQPHVPHYGKVDMATVDQIKALLESEPVANKFSPYRELNLEADALTVYFKPDPDYSKRLNDHITLYLSIETNQIVGCRIKGIAGILEGGKRF